MPIVIRVKKEAVKKQDFLQLFFFTPKQWHRIKVNLLRYTKITKYFMQKYKNGIIKFSLRIYRKTK